MTNAQSIATLRNLNKRFIHNFVTNDVASHDAILHPQFRCISSSGGHVDRGPYLEAWASDFDPEVILYWDMRDERITLIGDTAFVSACNRWIRLINGVETLGMTCYTDTYLRVGEHWLCALAQLTSVAPTNYPSDETIVVRYLKGVPQSE